MRPAPPIILPQAVVVHGVQMAQLAVATAAPLGGALTLLSAPGAGAYAGVGWWQALVALACPQGQVAHVLDCGEAPGRALEALRAGQRLLVLRCQPRVWQDLAERATANGGVLLAEPPAALDLGQPGATRRLRQWLAPPDC